MIRRALVLSGWLLALHACGDVEQCKNGEPGCLRGQPSENSTCQAGLVPYNGSCSEPNRSAAPLTCACAEGEVCTLDTYRCVNYCAPLDVKIGTGITDSDLSCDSTALGFEALCRNRCRFACAQQANFCDTPCEASACDGPKPLEACHSECGGDADPALCLAQRCADTRARGCREVTCTETAAPRCDGVICRNNCAGYNFDGVCDDGDLETARSSACTWGSDCADCGPRRGEGRQPSNQGEPCAFHAGCRGSNLEDLSQASAWCIEVDAEHGISRCAPDCSDPSKTCPEGSGCFSLFFGENQSDPQPLEQNGLHASACFPLQCGG